MITWQYGPYNEDEDGGSDGDGARRLMDLLQEMMFRYGASLEQSLEHALRNGLPVNLFLRESGLNPLIEAQIKELDERLAKLAEEIDPPVILARLRNEQEGLEKEIGAMALAGKDPLFTGEERKIIEHLLEGGRVSRDGLRSLRWLIAKQDSGWLKKNNRRLEKWQGLLADRARKQDLSERLERIWRDWNRRLDFGEADPGDARLAEILDQWEELEQLRRGFEEAAANGQLNDIDEDLLHRQLGQERFEEYQALLSSIQEKLKELLEKNQLAARGMGSDEEMIPTADSTRRISQRALREVFQSLRPDDAGSGYHPTAQTGPGEQEMSSSRPFEFGDSLAHLDLLTSLQNSFRKTGRLKLDPSQLEVFETRSSARSKTVLLLDMSGSMFRDNRFYNAKKVALALRELIMSQFQNDSLEIVGFGTFARSYSPAELTSLTPFSVTMFDPYINLRFPPAVLRAEKKTYDIPLYFTNLQKGLELSRRLLGGNQIRNKQIVLITDGAPTAHFDQGHLHINYPPSPANFEFALREVIRCREEGVTINAFLLTDEWSRALGLDGDEAFLRKFARLSRGRVFFPSSTDLSTMVMLDFLTGKKKRFTTDAGGKS